MVPSLCQPHYAPARTSACGRDFDLSEGQDRDAIGIRKIVRNTDCFSSVALGSDVMPATHVPPPAGLPFRPRGFLKPRCNFGSSDLQYGLPLGFSRNRAVLLSSEVFLTMRAIAAPSVQQCPTTLSAFDGDKPMSNRCPIYVRDMF